MGRVACAALGNSMQDSFIESFNCRPRDERLNETLFNSLTRVGCAYRLVARLKSRQAALETGSEIGGDNIK